jgi:hypothetical protein
VCGLAARILFVTHKMKKIFDTVLCEKIPQEMKDKILTYWDRFKVAPEIRIVDAKSEIKSAAVGPLKDDWPILHIFYFRSFLLNAPEDVLITIMRHELIHVFLDSDLKRETLLQKKLLNNQNTFKTGLEDSLSAITRVRLISFEEGLVGGLTEALGSDQNGALGWIAKNTDSE